MGGFVRRHIDILIKIITFPYSTCISSFFWQRHPYFFVHFLKCFLVLVKGTVPLPISHININVFLID